MRRLLLALALLLAAPAAAQDGAVLVANAVRVEGLDRLVADGDVEVLYGTSRLRARRIEYSQSTGRLMIQGPITLVDGDKVIIMADAAELDEDLRNGILTSARVVLDQQLQFAANQVRRVNGRYTEFTRTVASACEVCAANPVPLWSIRSRRAIHDQEEQQVYFEDATFLVMDLPVFYLPRLRLPDPTLKRATGFLIPSARTTNRLGTGIKVPYFIVLGDSRDITITPYLSARTTTLEFRYRQAFRHGRIEFNAAGGKDALIPNRTRGYLFGHGKFDLPRDFKLDFGIELASDPAYLLDYGYSDKDRLQTFVGVERVRRWERITARVINFRTLRDSEIPTSDQLPYLLGEAEYFRRFPGLMGGEGRLIFSAAGHQRESDADVVGRDMMRLGIQANWSRRWIFGPGIESSVQAGVTADGYFVGQDSNFDPYPSRVTPAVGMTFRWPLQRTGAGGVQHLLEPLAQVAWSDTWGGAVPNEDSTLAEFDQGNLLALNHFPGHDRTETGFRGALGVAYTRHDPAGWSLGVTVGRVFRADPAPDFTGASGLGGTASDWLAAIQLKSGGFALAHRIQISPGPSITKSETRLSWAGDRLMLAAAHVWIVAEPAEGRPDRTHELTFDTDYTFAGNWTASADMRYDFDAGRTQRAGFGIGYRTECLQVDLSLSRRFTSSTSVVPTTDVGLKVSLNGFGRDGREFRGTCAR